MSLGEVFELVHGHGLALLGATYTHTITRDGTDPAADARLELIEEAFADATLDAGGTYHSPTYTHPGTP